MKRNTVGRALALAAAAFALITAAGAQRVGAGGASGSAINFAARNWSDGGANNWTASTTEYCPFVGYGGGSCYTTTTSELDYVRTQLPVGGTVSKLYVTNGSGATQPSTGSIVITVRKDGANTTLTCTIAAGSSSGCTDSTDSFTFVAGDWISVSITNNATTTSNAVGAVAVEIQP